MSSSLSWTFSSFVFVTTAVEHARRVVELLSCSFVTRSVCLAYVTRRFCCRRRRDVQSNLVPAIAGIQRDFLHASRRSQRSARRIIN